MNTKYWKYLCFCLVFVVVGLLVYKPKKPQSGQGLQVGNKLYIIRPEYKTFVDSHGNSIKYKDYSHVDLKIYRTVDSNDFSFPKSENLWMIEINGQTFVAEEFPHDKN